MKSQNSGNPVYLVVVCLVATLGGLLFGYDTAVISGGIVFLRQYFQLSPAAEGWAASSALLGCVVGAGLAGTLNDHFGRKKVMLLSAVLFIVCAVGTALPRTLNEFVFFRFIGGIGVGAASMTSPLYIAEVSPARIRGRMVSLNQLAIVSGMLVVYFVNYFIAGLGDETWKVNQSWRWMFASQNIPGLLFLVLLFLVPESPRWLAQRGREDRALAVLARVNGEQQAPVELQRIREALDKEGQSLLQVFQPGMRLVLIIGIMLAVLQQVTGINVFLYYAPEIFKRIAGAQTDVALLQTVVIGAVNLLFTLVAIGTVDRWGRKPLMIAGFAGMGISLFALGFAAYLQRTDIWILVFILGYI
ncbi:MAG TPA: sugar porter family MFS transporter, partial [Verrucomicrobiota bacterium]|nr:sugar porter family MFS transporter [Verrucomicrobiota bacterium]